jgi:hypothetical protein
MELQAEKLEVLPQFGDTCWFNAILMVMLYSQGLREFVYQKALEWRSNDPKFKINKFKKNLLFILENNYTRPEIIKKLFAKRMTPELLLLSYLDYYHGDTINKTTLISDLERFLQDYSYEYEYTVINDIFWNIFRYGIDYLDIYFINGKLYLSKKLEIEAPVPTILLLFHEDFFPSGKTKEDYYKYTTDVDLSDEYQMPSSIKLNGKYVYFNGFKYKLDCCLIANYNIDAIKKGHAIAGLTYNNQGYIYNGWTQLQTTQERKKEFNKKRREPCKLFSRDWIDDIYAENGNNGFCIPANCSKLEAVQEKYYCFDFSKKQDGKILIYVKTNEQYLEETTVNIPKSIQYSSLSLEKLTDKYHNFKGKSLNDLIKILEQFGYTQNSLQNLLADFSNYSTLFFIICNIKQQKQESSLEDEKKLFLINLIMLYLKKNKILLLEYLNNNLIYDNLTEKTLKKAIKQLNYKLSSYEQLNDYSILFHVLVFYYKQNLPNTDIKTLFHFFLQILLDINISNDRYFDLDLYTDENIIQKLLATEYEESFTKTLEYSNRNQFILIDILKHRINHQNHLNEEEAIQELLIFISNLTLNDLIRLMNYYNQPLKGGAYTKKRQLKSYK